MRPRLEPSYLISPRPSSYHLQYRFTGSLDVRFGVQPGLELVAVHSLWDDQLWQVMVGTNRGGGVWRTQGLASTGHGCLSSGLRLCITWAIYPEVVQKNGRYYICTKAGYFGGKCPPSFYAYVTAPKNLVAQLVQCISIQKTTIPAGHIMHCVG